MKHTLHDQINSIIEDETYALDAADKILALITDNWPTSTKPVVVGEPFDLENPMDYTDLRDFYIAHNGMKE